MENFGISLKLSSDQLEKELYKLFPNQEFFFWDREINNETPEDVVLFCIFSNQSEFPIAVNLYNFPAVNISEREQYIARQLSSKLSCRTIVSYQIPSSPSYPYASLIFDNGKCYLADDHGTMWADDEGDLVRIVDEIELDQFRFDEFGNLVIL